MPWPLAAEVLGLDAAGLAALARTAVDVSFAPEEVKADVREQIDGYAASA